MSAGAEVAWLGGQLWVWISEGLGPAVRVKEGGGKSQVEHSISGVEKGRDLKGRV